MSEGWRPDSYLDDIRVEISQYDELQERVVNATRDLAVRHALELGVGTGETTRRLLALHRLATIVGTDGSEEMLSAARAGLPADRVDLRLARLEDPLPSGNYDLVVSVLAAHHVEAHGKMALFSRIAAALAPEGRFVLGDVVVPERPEDSIIPMEEGFDFPNLLTDQLSWLVDSGLSVTVDWSSKDLAVVRAEVQAPV